MKHQRFKCPVLWLCVSVALVTNFLSTLHDHLRQHGMPEADFITTLFKLLIEVFLVVGAATGGRTERTFAERLRGWLGK